LAWLPWLAGLTGWLGAVGLSGLCSSRLVVRCVCEWLAEDVCLAVLFSCGIGSRCFFGTVLLIY